MELLCTRTSDFLLSFWALLARKRGPSEDSNWVLWHGTFLFLFSYVCWLIFTIPYTSEIVLYLSFSLWLISLSLIYSMSFHVANGKILFLLLEKEMATHSSVLAWRIPGTGEPGGLPSMGPHIVGHDWSDLAAAAAAFHWVYVLHLLYPFICWWTFMALLYFGLDF